jgi:hypothetical protein
MEKNNRHRYVLRWSALGQGEYFIPFPFKFPSQIVYKKNKKE